MLVHDLRRLSTSIYHAAEEARSAHYAGETAVLRDRLESILAAHGMLKLRTDVLDFARNPSGEHQVVPVKVFKKVDKVVRSFRPVAEKKNIQLNIKGPSTGTCLGPDVFEIIPYLVIDNAIKYSPSNASVEVSCYDTNNTVEVVIVSIGPKILPQEVAKVFEKGFRSQAARNGQKSGTGTGLFLAKNLVQQFRGRIWVEVCTKDIETSAEIANEVSFCISLPKEAN